MSLSLVDTILVMPEHFAMLFSCAVFAFPRAIMFHVAGNALHQFRCLWHVGTVALRICMSFMVLMHLFNL